MSCSCGRTPLSSNILFLAIFHDPCWTRKPPTSNSSRYLLHSFLVTFLLGPSIFRPLAFLVGTSPHQGLILRFNIFPYSFVSIFPAYIDSSIWVPFFVAHNLSTFCTQRHRLTTTLMHDTWRRGPVHAPTALSHSLPCHGQLEYPHHAEANTSSLLHNPQSLPNRETRLPAQIILTHKMRWSFPALSDALPKLSKSSSPVASGSSRHNVRISINTSTRSNMYKTNFLFTSVISSATCQTITRNPTR